MYQKKRSKCSGSCGLSFCAYWEDPEAPACRECIYWEWDEDDICDGNSTKKIRS